MTLQASGLFIVALCSIALTSSAAPPTQAPSHNPPEQLVQDETFEPYEESRQGLDWIQLTSGEWLRGTVDRIRVDSISFDSKELDDLTLDLDDVYAVVTNGPQTVSLDTRRIVVGTVAIRGNVVRVRTDTGIETYTRADIMGMVPGLPTEWNYWSGSASVGLTLQRGNTNQTDFTALASIMRETSATRLRSQYNGTVSSANGVKTGDSQRVTIQGDILLTRRFYITPVKAGYYMNKFQGIDLQITPSAGIGYSVVDNGRTSINVGIGAGANYTRAIIEGPPSSLESRTNATVNLDIRFDTDITKNIEWTGEYNLALGVPDTRYTVQHAVTTLSVDMWRDIDLDTSFLWDRNDANSDPSVPGGPVADDYRLTFGLGIDF